MLRNHGLITVGRTIGEAFFLMYVRVLGSSFLSFLLIKLNNQLYHIPCILILWLLLLLWWIGTIYIRRVMSKLQRWGNPHFFFSSISTSNHLPLSTSIAISILLLLLYVHLSFLYFSIWLYSMLTLNVHLRKEKKDDSSSNNNNNNNSNSNDNTNNNNSLEGLAIPPQGVIAETYRIVQNNYTGRPYGVVEFKALRRRLDRTTTDYMH